jgi:Flp pilus assembly protein TadG
MLHRQTGRSDRGAAAVEFALVLPLLLLMIFGIVEFGRAYNVQISITNAAREGARVMAVHNDPALARTAASAAAPAVIPAVAPGNVTVAPTDCVAGATVTVTIRYTVTLVTGFFGPGIPLTGRGVMLCGG